MLLPLYVFCMSTALHFFEQIYGSLIIYPWEVFFVGHVYPPTTS